MSAPLAFLSLLIEAVAGYPNWLVKLIGHPVIWIGNLIAALESNLNRPEYSDRWRRRLGVLTLLLLVLITGGSAYLAEIAFWNVPFGIIAVAIVASSLLAQRSLARHVAAVADALDEGGIAEGRKAVSQIVGRDPERLDEPAICRAAIESLAENFSDGIVAPAFWLAVFGLPGAAGYKAVNTADSMIGHKNERYRDFGWASARLDDLINLPASRLTALLLVGAACLTPGANAGDAWRAVRRDAKRHRSPNAGWPEAAMAGALGLSIAGPRHYGGVLTTDAPMGDGRRELNATDIRRALRLYWVADTLLVAMIGLLALLTWHF